MIPHFIFVWLAKKANVQAHINERLLHDMREKWIEEGKRQAEQPLPPIFGGHPVYVQAPEVPVRTPTPRLFPEHNPELERMIGTSTMPAIGPRQHGMLNMYNRLKRIKAEERMRKIGR